MIYTIPKGNHYPRGFRFSPFLKSPEQEYIVRFDESCMYSVEHQSSWNKLFGQTHGLPKNSSRWAWRYHPIHGIQIMPYLHENGRIRRGLYSTVPMHTDIRLEISSVSDSVFFFLDGKGYDCWQPPTKCRIGYRQWPYFGGRSPAPHDVRIYMSEV